MSKFRVAYLAYPLDQVAASMSWLYETVEQVKRSLLESDLVDVVFDPGDAFNVRKGANVGPEIEQINAFAQSASELTVAFLPAGVATIGVPMEIDRAARAGRTVIVFTDNNRSWSLSGLALRPNVRVHNWDVEGQANAYLWLSERPQEADPATAQEQDPLPVRLLYPESRLPTRGYGDDAGLDLYVVGNWTIEAGAFLDVPCGVAVELPDWSWGLLTGRSSTLRAKKLLVHSGIIDSGYRGPLFAGVWNMSEVDVEVKNGERIAQLIILPNTTKDVNPVQASSLKPHERGEAGFGSTGE